MRIFVVGNINSGKTYTISKLRRIFPEYPVLSIDEYRKQYADGTIEKEASTRLLFAKDIIQMSDAIIEFSGGSNITDLFVNELRPNSTIVLEIEANLNDCLNRIKQKDFSKTPYPKYSESIEDTITRLDGLFKSNMIGINFEKVTLKHFKITSDDNLENIPLKQCENAIKVADIFEKMPVSLFAFGSLSNDSLNIHSDIDLFMKTDLPMAKIKDALSLHYPNSEIIIQKNQIALYNHLDLIEINVIKFLDEARLFYCNSEIKNIQKTILIDEANLLLNLTNMVNTYNYDVYQDIANTLSRMTYYYYSLPRIVSKNDLYKYYFHTNILMHEYIRLGYLTGGNIAYSYLPKRATNYVGIEELKRLMFKMDDDTTKHLSTIKPLVENMIVQTKGYLREHMKH